MNIEISNKTINTNSSTFIIAELSANHNQNYDVALKTIEAIKKSGADAVKIQTYTPDTMTIDCNNEYFKIKHDTLWDGMNLYDLYKKAYTPWEWQPKLKKIAEDLGLIFFSSPFDKTSVDFLEELNVPAYKIASFEITDIPLIEYVASKGKPMIISTGVAEIDDINEAIEACKRNGNDNIILLKCTSSYPAPIEDVNIKTIPDMIERFKTIVGLSDHTITSSAAIGAVALGAKVIEKHFILDRSISGPDSAFSIEPKEFSNMVKSIREVESSLGEISYKLNERSKKSRKFVRSLFVVENMKKGDVFSEDNIRSIRPGDGLPPKYLNDILGKKAKKELKRGVPLNWEVIE